jgi:hypothetical protein
MDIHSSVNLPFGLLLNNLSFAKDIFPDRDFFSQRFHYETAKNAVCVCLKSNALGNIPH